MVRKLKAIAVSNDRVATTFRIDPVVKDGLFKLSGLLHQSLNQLANEAIKEFVARRALEVEADLEATLEDLRAYRKRDPDFDQAIDDLIEAEATLTEDPAEGRVTSAPGPTESAVLSLLNG